MNEHEKSFPELRYFFMGYFHQNWVDLYDWSDGKASFKVVVQDFKNSETREIQKKVVEDLRSLIEQDLSEIELRKMITQNLGANVYPPNIGLTYQQWLEAVLRILDD